MDATRGPRAKRGDVWVFDPQQLVDEPANWWWNPLTYVTDEVKAAELADVFTAAYADPEARTDAFFDPKGQKVVATLLLAAALAEPHDRPGLPVGDRPARRRAGRASAAA